MADDPTDPRPYLDPERLPWTRLFRAVGVALDAKKLLLAALGLGLLSAGWAGLDRLFPDSTAVTPPVMTRPLRTTQVGPLTLIPPFGPGSEGDPAAVRIGPMLGLAADRVADPFRVVVSPFVALFDPSPPPGAFWHAALASAWALLVWGIVGGAIARIAVVQVALGERVGIRGALRFALGKAIPLIGAPLTPFVGVACFAGLCALMGLLYRIPADAARAAWGALLFLPLLAGLVMAIILLGLAVGWPLMHATVAAEGEDGFDALSRTYAYVYQRPGRYAAYAALAWILGSVGFLVVLAFARATVSLAHWGLAIGAPDASVNPLFRIDPGANPGASASIHAGWLRFVDLLAYGWIYSYFWTSAAIIYLLLRHDVDGTEWHDLGHSVVQEVAPPPSATAEAGPTGPEPGPPIDSSPIGSPRVGPPA